MIRLFPLLALVAAGCPKQTPVSRASRTPTAEMLFASYHQAIGGVNAMAPSTMHTTMKADMNGMAITVDAYMVPPASMLSRTVLPGVGTIEQGFDGTHGWETSPITGARLIVGAELDALRESADQRIANDYQALYPKAAVFGPETFADQDAWRVEATTPSGRTKTMWFSVNTSLELGSSELNVSDLGEVQTRTTLSDYQTFDGMTVPTRILQSMGDALNVEMTMTAFERGIPLDPIVPPPEVAELIAEQQEDAAGEDP